MDTLRTIKRLARSEVAAWVVLGVSIFVYVLAASVAAEKTSSTVADEVLRGSKRHREVARATTHAILSRQGRKEKRPAPLYLYRRPYNWDDASAELRREWVWYELVACLVRRGVRGDVGKIADEIAPRAVDCVELGGVEKNPLWFALQVEDCYDRISDTP